MVEINPFWDELFTAMIEGDIILDDLIAEDDTVTKSTNGVNVSIHLNTL